MEITSVSLFRRWPCIDKSDSPLESALHSIGDVYWHSSLKFLGISGAYVFRASEHLVSWDFRLCYFPEHLVYPAERGSSKRAFACVRAAGASEDRNSNMAISLLGFGGGSCWKHSKRTSRAICCAAVERKAGGRKLLVGTAVEFQSR
ncbi:uncharacterized protein LOC133740936 [Rosa rugosa]|uniref:uncharacterized protein LOC133740936 n=1 Tax=Rosa rugosa TaxID=74645 RepID=UPI002B412483|nr:uncharacterized protein LOC133740936 [Rosa rugosa]